MYCIFCRAKRRAAGGSEDGFLLVHPVVNLMWGRFFRCRGAELILPPASTSASGHTAGILAMRQAGLLGVIVPVCRHSVYHIWRNLQGQPCLPDSRGVRGHDMSCVNDDDSPCLSPIESVV